VSRAASAQHEVDRDTYLRFEGQRILEHRIVNTGVTRESVIRREVHQEIGSAFAVVHLQEDLTRLENLGLFSRVHVEVLERQTGIVLEYHITEMPWIVPYFSFRYNDENGWSIGPAVASLNLFGRGISLSGRALFGGTNTFEARLLWPWIAFDHLSLDLTVNNLVRQDEILDFEEHSREFTPWVGTYLGEHGRLAGTLSWFQMNADVSGRTLSASNRDNLVRLGMRLGWDSRDSWRDPRHGWQNQFELMQSGGWLGGQGDYLQATFDIRRFEPIGARQTLFLGGLTSLSTGTVGEDFPPYFIFRMGGANTIRGYDVKELGKRLYGKNQMIYTAEYLFNLVELRSYRLLRWSVSLGFQAALFADVGVAWNEDSQLTWKRFRSGYGGGLRMLIPGSEVIRFDLGVSEDGDVALHFGPWFRWTAQRNRLR
jgi:outer membrane protein assembly factor BamA